VTALRFCLEDCRVGGQGIPDGEGISLWEGNFLLGRGVPSRRRTILWWRERWYGEGKVEDPLLYRDLKVDDA
jgi:hypothetical protein